MRDKNGDVECALCGRRCFIFTKYPVCWDCVYWMYDDGKDEGMTRNSVETAGYATWREEDYYNSYEESLEDSASV